jgi:hypothetical protein
MKLVRTVVLLWLIVALSGTWGLAWDTPVAPRTPPAPPAPPLHLSPPVEAPGEGLPGALALPPLKAVLLVGPIDGDYGPWTNSEKANMDQAAAELAANGVTVHKFYTPSNNWEQIKAAAEGAHFLFYRGHGVYWSSMPSPTVGGFALKDRFVSSEGIRRDLALAPNAIVMLYGCFTAGSSSIDDPPIDSVEARRRVAQYSDPFLDVGAAGYYANWFGDAFQLFVRALFQGKTLGQAYESFYDFSGATVERYAHPDHPDLAMWLDKDFWGGKAQYNNAFAGLPDRTLADLFLSPEMTVSPSAITHLAEPGSPPRVFSLVIGTTTAIAFDWAASVTLPVSWLDAQPLGGSSGQTIQVSVAPAGQAVGTYQTGIRIVAASPGLHNGDQKIPVTLHVVDQVHKAYLPVVVSSSVP